MEYYLNGMESAEQKLDIQKYHDEMRQNGFIFNFVQQIVEYCEDDTKILSLGMLYFLRESFVFERNLKEIFGTDHIPSDCVGYQNPLSKPFSTSNLRYEFHKELISYVNWFHFL